MADFSEKIKNAPKGLLIMGGITLLVLLLFGIYKFAIEDMIKPKAAETEKPQIVIDFPDANEDGKDLSKLDEIRHQENTKSRTRTSDYWNSLGPDGDDGGLVAGRRNDGRVGAARRVLCSKFRVACPYDDRNARRLQRYDESRQRRVVRKCRHGDGL